MLSIKCPLYHLVQAETRQSSNVYYSPAQVLKVQLRHQVTEFKGGVDGQRLNIDLHEIFDMCLGLVGISCPPGQSPMHVGSFYWPKRGRERWRIHTVINKRGDPSWVWRAYNVHDCVTTRHVNQVQVVFIDLFLSLNLDLGREGATPCQPPPPLCWICHRGGKRVGLGSTVKSLGIIIFPYKYTVSANIEFIYQ